ncbi:MAG: cation-translocating P-type ATPase, partial [Alphaproteobacteria bacterium]
MAAGSDDAPFWAIGPEDLARRLASGRQGLSSREAAGRLARFGGNHVAKRAAQGALRLLLSQFESPLVLVLVFAACVSAALREWVDAGIVVAIVVASALLGFAQEHRASTAMRQLRQRLALVARVLRDGAERDIPAASVVPGDVVLLSAGKLVPADGLVLEATDFLVSEAAITGESFPVEKRPGIVAADAPPAGRGNAVFLGSSVRSGTARMLVVHTGRATDFGAIAERLRQRAPETEFARGVRHFGQMLVRTMLVIVFAVLTANLLLGRPTIDSLLFSVALAVGLTPELLPAIVTVTLAAGARAMGRRGVILRRLEAMENLGSMDVLCTDKTGTLTTGAIAMKDALDAAGSPDREVARLAFLNAALETGIENPLDAAIVAAGQAAGMDVSGVAKIDEIPYDFMRRCLTIVVADPDAPGRHLLVTKGAFANVLERCTSLRGPGGDVPLDAGARAALDAIFRARGAEGERVLALATRSVEARPRHDREEERDMVFRGFLAFEDPPRPDAAAAIAGLAELGIRIKVVSGDNRHVTAHLARAVGLDPRSMLAGP